MKIKIEKKLKKGAKLLVLPVFANQDSLASGIPGQDFLKTRIKAGDFAGKKNQMVATYLDNKYAEKILLVGLGEEKSYTSKVARNIGGSLGKYLKKQELEEVSMYLTSQKFAPEFVQGIALSQYNRDSLKTSKKKPQLKTLHLITGKNKDLESQISDSLKLVEAVDYVKDLVNAPSNYVDASYLASEARKIAKDNRYKIAVFGDKKLRKMGWGGLLAVNQGSEKEAKAIILQYDGAKKRKEKPIILIGKGIIFDSGGYSLKSSRGMMTMHQDMAGAATVLGVFSVLKRLGIKRNVIGIIASTENLVNEKAYRPADIITMLSGQTVEITNTDAEGRLVLADSITYASSMKPECLITMATLTGAVRTATGDRYAGLIGNHLRYRKGLSKAGREVDDLAWPLPLHQDYKKAMDSQVADIQNCDMGTSHIAGSSKGAAFLERFIDGNNWCHLDLGGTAFTESPKTYQGKGATGHSVRLLVRFLQNLTS